MNRRPGGTDSASGGSPKRLGWDRITVVPLPEERHAPVRSSQCLPGQSPFPGGGGNSDDSALYTPAPMIAPVIGARM